MLQGGNTASNGWEPDVVRMLEGLADQLTVPEDGAPVMEDIRYQSLMALYTFSSNNPNGWSLMQRFLLEQSRSFADKCASINPAEDPLKRHGQQCYNAGAAAGIMLAIKALNPKVLKARLIRMQDSRRSSAVVAMERGLDS